MKKLIYTFAIIALFMGLYACNQAPQTKKHANWVDSTFQSDTMVVDSTHIPREICFIHLSGKSSHKDSSFVNLSILGNKVMGKYCWIPFEKDSRTGTISGVKNGDTINVVWSFIQEGMKDTLATTFLLQGNQLKQRPFTVDRKTGRQQTDKRSAFTLTFQQIPCK